MKLSYEQVMDRANAHYRALKGERDDPSAKAPKIYSDQVKSLAKALVELINEAEAKD